MGRRVLSRVTTCDQWRDKVRVMASACVYTGATWGVPVEPIDLCIPQCTWCVETIYRASEMDLIVSSMNLWVMHYSSLFKTCSTVLGQPRVYGFYFH